MIAQSEQQSKQKYITLMRNLISHINENPTHQLTIYQCLNTEQIKRLFQSLHDHSRTIRFTALYFVCKLLHNAPHIVETLLIRDNCDVGIGARKSGSQASGQKFIVTGLAYYQMDPLTLAQVVVTVNSKVKYKKNVLFWYVEIATKNIGYFPVGSSLQQLNIDPQTHVIGIFVGDQQQTNKQITKIISGTTSSTMIRKNTLESAKGKYTISKAGQFSISRKN